MNIFPRIAMVVISTIWKDRRRGEIIMNEREGRSTRTSASSSVSAGVWRRFVASSWASNVNSVPISQYLQLEEFNYICHGTATSAAVNVWS